MTFHIKRSIINIWKNFSITDYNLTAYIQNSSQSTLNLNMK